MRADGGLDRQRRVRRRRSARADDGRVRRSSRARRSSAGRPGRTGRGTSRRAAVDGGGKRRGSSATAAAGRRPQRRTGRAACRSPSPSGSVPMAPAGWHDGARWAATRRCGRRRCPVDGRVEGTPLGGDIDVDVAIVGGGFTGLWTALSLATARPGAAGRRARASRRRVRRERPQRRVVLGAAGDEPARATPRRTGGRRPIAAQRAMHDTVDEVGRFAAAARRRRRLAPRRHRHATPAPRPSAGASQDELDEARAFGFGDDDLRWMDADELDAVGRPPGTLAAAFTPHCAACTRCASSTPSPAPRPTPACALHTHTAVEVVEPRRLVTTGGTVRADVVVLATEAYTATMRRPPPRRRARVLADGRLRRADAGAVGRRRPRRAADVPRRPAHGRLRPAHGRRAHRVRRPRRAVPRSARGSTPASTPTSGSARCSSTRCASCSRRSRDVRVPVPLGRAARRPARLALGRALRPRRRLAVAGGYVGDGVATTNLAGRTLADLILGRDTDLVRLPWVGHRSRPWEPEPLRWLGVNLGRVAAARADAAEAGTSRLARARAAAWSRAPRHPDPPLTVPSECPRDRNAGQDGHVLGWLVRYSDGSAGVRRRGGSAA